MRTGTQFSNLSALPRETTGRDVRILSGARGDMPYWPHLRPAHAAEERAALRQLHETGELAGYAEQELMAYNFLIVWRKSLGVVLSTGERHPDGVIEK